MTQLLIVDAIQEKIRASGLTRAADAIQALLRPSIRLL
jgi:hypothetical protein